MKIGLPKGKLTSGLIGFVESNDVDDGSELLSESEAHVLSAESLSSTNIGRTFISGPKKRRTANMSGL